LDNRGKVNERKLAEFLSRNGQHLLPMVELVEPSPLAVDELVHTVGRVTVQTILRISTEQIGAPRRCQPGMMYTLLGVLRVPCC
jgi:hypothetical protein